MTAEDKIKHYNNDYSVNDELLNAVKELIKIKCKEQREICSNELDILENYNKALNQILNSPEPEI